ncbi:MAG: hypothetical protein BroJett013_34820 [Alphaproteobacteria bacterium]|nr:MAG: hypothetical protein BroJett013_34820 [Alphaproteobacteria bacterium]
MGEREIGLAGALAGLAMAFVLIMAVPAQWTVELALASASIEISASFAGATLQFSL